MAFLQWLQQLPISTWVSESPSIFGYPTVLLLHVMGMAIVVGISAIISLRLLGFAQETALQPLERLYPLMWWGFGLNAVTGTALMLASATMRLVDPVFYLKMIFIFAGVAMMQRTRKKAFRRPDPEAELPGNAKTLAWASLICWVGAVTAGRMLAYL